MLAGDLITDEIPSLKLSDTGLKALQWMEEFKVSHLPIVNNLEFLGLITDADIFDLNTPDSPLSNHKLSLIRPFVYAENHIYEVIKVVYTLKLTLIPVLEGDNKYWGVISLPVLVGAFAEMSAVSNPGGIIILELNTHDYSLNQIAHIVEDNDAKILSSYITSKSDSSMLEITLKINRTDLSAILQTFSRYDYVVKASYHQSEFPDDMKARFDSFMNYLNM